MKELNFCLQCGEPTLRWDGQTKLSCNNCGFVLYQNVAAAVAVLLKFDDKFLFTKREKDPKKGFLDLPGGFTDPKESGEFTCARELKEELNLEISEENFKYLGSFPNIYFYKNIEYHTLDLFFTCDLMTKPDFSLQKEEISAVKWLAKDEIKLADLAFESQQKFLKQFFKIS